MQQMLLKMPEGKLYRAYKTELNPTEDQRKKMRQNMGVCRFLYNEYLNMNIHLFRMYNRGLLDEQQDHFISAINFDKYVNRKLKVLPKYEWINRCGSKARKKALVNAETAYKNYFQQKRSFPRFKAKHRNTMKLYFPRSNATDWQISRYWVKIPTFGKVRLKEYGYLPQNIKVVSGTVSSSGGRYFVSVLVETQLRFQSLQSECKQIEVHFDQEHFIRLNGIDGFEGQGREHLAKMQKLQRRLRREKRSLCRKLAQRPHSGHIEAQRLRIEKLLCRAEYIKKDYLYKMAAKLLGYGPSRIVLWQMEKRRLNERLEKDTAYMRQMFYVFGEHLCHKAKLLGISFELRQ